MTALIHLDRAIVVRPAERADAPERYMLVTPGGAVVWTSDAALATAFESMREATRAAARLPSALRAYSLPRGAELTCE